MQNKEKPFISFVVYVPNFNVLSRFLSELDVFAHAHFEVYEMVLVAEKEMSDFESMMPHARGKLTVLELAWSHGADLALAAGSDFAIGDFIFEIDATTVDYAPDLLFELYQKTISGYDITIASPKMRHVPLSTRVFYRLLKRFSYLTFHLTSERVRLVTRRALNAASKVKDKVQYRKILYQYSGFPSFVHQYTPQMRSTEKRSLRNKISLAIEILVSFSNIGLQLSFLASLVFFVISLLLGAYAIFIYFTLQTRVEGWTTLMLFLSFGFSSMFLVMGLLSKYVVLILQEVKNRPLYTIKSIHKLEEK